MVEVADIFHKYGDSYRKAHKLPLRILKVMSAIENCRTSNLGGHVDECDTCGYLKISYNSCRNRHCPKCQGLAREKWLTARKKELLPVHYFHLVFTLPDKLNSLTLQNQREIYTILFKSSSETLLELGKDIKYLGAEIGFISILHTWGQNLMDHPHVHCLAPGGGLSLDGDRWIFTRKKFFIPVKVLSRLFRGKFLANLKKAYQRKKLEFQGNLKLMNQQQNFQKLLDELYKKEWVVYCKPPFSNSEQILEYLGRYTHRVAISNNRITDIENGKVTFRWRDYKNGNQNKTMQLDAFEFIRRFLLHILPDKFVKIRHYGILSNRTRKTKIKRCQEILSTKDRGQAETILDLKSLESETQKNNFEKCPVCGNGIMIVKEVLCNLRYKPPDKKTVA